MNPIHQNLRGKRYRIVFTHDGIGKDEDGRCDGPEVADKTIRIRPNLARRRKLAITIHEALHACCWDLDDEAVDTTATDIAALLWRLGYRRINTAAKAR